MKTENKKNEYKSECHGKGHHHHHHGKGHHAGKYGEEPDSHHGKRQILYVGSCKFSLNTGL